MKTKKQSILSLAVALTAISFATQSFGWGIEATSNLDQSKSAGGDMNSNNRTKSHDASGQSQIGGTHKGSTIGGDNNGVAGDMNIKGGSFFAPSNSASIDNRDYSRGGAATGGDASGGIATGGRSTAVTDTGKVKKSSGVKIDSSSYATGGRTQGGRAEGGYAEGNNSTRTLTMDNSVRSTINVNDKLDMSTNNSQSFGGYTQTGNNTTNNTNSNNNRGTIK